MRAALALVSLAAVLAALAACDSDAAPQAAPAADPSPAARSQAATPTPTPVPPAPTPAPSLAPMPSAFAPGDRSSAVQPPFEAPGFSLATGFGERVALQDLLAEHEAVVLVFYRGVF